MLVLYVKYNKQYCILLEIQTMTENVVLTSHLACSAITVFLSEYEKSLNFTIACSHDK